MIIKNTLKNNNSKLILINHNNHPQKILLEFIIIIVKENKEWKKYLLPRILMTINKVKMKFNSNKMILCTKI